MPELASGRRGDGGRAAGRERERGHAGRDHAWGGDPHGHPPRGGCIHPSEAPAHQRGLSGDEESPKNACAGRPRPRRVRRPCGGSRARPGEWRRKPAATSVPTPLGRRAKSSARRLMMMRPRPRGLVGGGGVGGEDGARRARPALVHDADLGALGRDGQIHLDRAAEGRAVLDRVRHGLGGGEQDAPGAVGRPLLAGQHAGERGAHEGDHGEVGRNAEAGVDAGGHRGHTDGFARCSHDHLIGGIRRHSTHPIPPEVEERRRRLDSRRQPTGGSDLPEHRPVPPVASYLAQPHEVHRVVLLYSGGLDTSVMLKWIQDEYDAEVVALCIDLGQPADDFDAVRQKALDLGAVASLVVDAKEEFARDYVAPAIRANARYQGGYPLFTVARPAPAGQARLRRRARARRRHDRARLHRQGQRPGAHRGDRRDARARPQGHRAGARVADGPRRGDRLRAGARHPGHLLGRAALLDRRQPLGPLVRGRRHRGPRPAAARRTSSSWSPTRPRRRTARRTSSSASATGCR